MQCPRCHGSPSPLPRMIGSIVRTLSVWEDEASLRRFVQQNPHEKVMMDLLPHMGQTAFVPFKVDASSIPPDWEDTKRRMRER